MSSFDYRLIDSAGSEIGIIRDVRPVIAEGESVTLPDGHEAEVLDVYDDEYGREGGVVATPAVERRVIVRAVGDSALSPDFPLGDALEVFMLCGRAEPFSLPQPRHARPG